MARRLSDDDVDVRANILDAADRLMSARGYAATSAQAVADEAGVNKALVFYYFGNKAGLYAAVLARYDADMRRRMAEAAFAPDGRPPRPRLHRLLDAFVDFYEQNPGYPRLVLQELADPRDDKLLAFNRRNFSLTTAAMQPVLGVDEDTVAHLVLTISGIVMHYFSHGPMLGPVLPFGDPMTPEARAARRTHLHWVVDCMLDRLWGPGREAPQDTPGGSST